jgi:hypothetical protein
LIGRRKRAHAVLRDMSSEEESVDRTDHGNDNESDADAVPPERVDRKRRGVAAELDPEKLAEFAEADRRRGVVYVSRIPPFMKPIKLRHLLEKFAQIGRVYLAPEGEDGLACHVDGSPCLLIWARLRSVRSGCSSTTHQGGRQQETEIHGGVGRVRKQARSAGSCRSTE